MRGRMAYPSLALLQNEGTFIDFYAIGALTFRAYERRTPIFIAYEPLLLGMRVVFNILMEIS